MARKNGPRKHYGKWRIRWTDADGKRRSEVHEKHRTADLALQRHIVEAEEIRRGLRPRPVVGHRFSELLDYQLEHRTPKKRSAKDDRAIIRKHLRPTFGHLMLTEITIQKVDAFKAGFSVEQEKTLHNILTLLITMLTMAVDELRWLDYRPKIRKPSLPKSTTYRYLRTEKEIARILVAARRFREDVFVLYATAIYTGMRAGELAGLEWSDIDVAKRLITVQRSYGGPTKNGCTRYTPIFDPLLPLLNEWRGRGSGVGLVFPNTVGNMHQESARVFQENLHSILSAANFPESRKIDKKGKVKVRRYIVFHSLRHTFASHWVMNGGTLPKLQSMGGWESYKMVQIYAHLDPDAYSTDYGRMGGELAIGEPADEATIEMRVDGTEISTLH